MKVSTRFLFVELIIFTAVVLVAISCSGENGSSGGKGGAGASFDGGGVGGAGTGGSLGGAGGYAGNCIGGGQTCPGEGCCVDLACSENGKCCKMSGECSTNADCCATMFCSDHPAGSKGSCSGTCYERGWGCDKNEDCCSGLCGGGSCGCSPAGASCFAEKVWYDKECCSGSCSNHKCAACIEKGFMCKVSAECCDGQGPCNGGYCQCKGLGAPCDAGSECCSGGCTGGKCV